MVVKNQIQYMEQLATWITFSLCIYGSKSVERKKAATLYTHGRASEQSVSLQANALAASATTQEAGPHPAGSALPKLRAAEVWHCIIGALLI